MREGKEIMHDLEETNEGDIQEESKCEVENVQSFSHFQHGFEHALSEEPHGQDQSHSLFVSKYELFKFLCNTN